MILVSLEFFEIFQTGRNIKDLSHECSLNDELSDIIISNANFHVFTAFLLIKIIYTNQHLNVLIQ